MESVEKTCGSCMYGDYYKRKGATLKTAVMCEVYSHRMERGHKACHNWKERKDGRSIREMPL